MERLGGRSPVRMVPFEIRLPEGTSGPSVLIVEAPQCGLLGFYSPDGFSHPG